MRTVPDCWREEKNAFVRRFRLFFLFYLLTGSNRSRMYQETCFARWSLSLEDDFGVCIVRGKMTLLLKNIRISEKRARNISGAE